MHIMFVSNNATKNILSHVASLFTITLKMRLSIFLLHCDHSVSEKLL